MPGDAKKVYKLLGIKAMTETEFVNVMKMPASKRKPFLEDLAKKEKQFANAAALIAALEKAGLS